MDHLPAFKLWLQNKHYSDATIRNYLVDLGKYLNYVNRLPQTVSLDPTTTTDIHILSPNIISLYVSYLSGKTNSSRYLASLNQFCQFAIDQGLISQNPLKEINKPISAPTISTLVSLYQQHLTTHQNSPTTIKNYINDLNQYISWLDTQKIDPQQSN